LNKTQSIFITGATGFVGAYVLRELLRQGYTRIKAIHRSPLEGILLKETFESVTWIKADIEDYFSLEDAITADDLIIHCAALVSFYKKDKDQLFQTNQLGTRNIVNAALHQKAKRLIYISSVAALGRNVEGFATSEETKWDDGQDVTNYALSKFLAEQEVWRGQAEGLSIALLYPSIVLGAWKWTTGTAKMFAFANQGSSYYPTGTTGVVDVRDVAKAVLLLIERNLDTDRFLLNSTNISYQSLLGKMAISLGQKPPHRVFPERWAQLLTLLDSWRSWLTRNKPLLTKETTKASYKNHVYDNTLSKKTLGKSYIPKAQTIEETATIFKQTKKNGISLLE